MKKLLFLLLFCASCALARVGVDMPQKQTVVTPTGIVSQPNEYGKLPPGTLREGDNICIRKSGVIEPRPAFEDFGSTLATGVTGPYGVLKIWPVGPEQILALVGGEVAGNPVGTYKVVHADGSVAAITNGPSTTLRPGKTQITKTRDRTFLVANSPPFVIADEDLDEVSSVPARQAGLPMPSYISIDNSDAGDVLTDQMYMSYRAVFRHTEGDYTFQGAVSAAYATLNNTGTDSFPEVTVYWDSLYTPVGAGDQIELFRTAQQEELDLLGDGYRYALTYTLTSTDITNGFAVISDNSIETGADLYYDQSQEGASQNNFMPPSSVDAVTFKEATFYVEAGSFHTRVVQPLNGWRGHSAGQPIIGDIEKTITYLATQNTLTTASNAGLEIGMLLINPDFPAGTVILAISGSGPYVVLVSALSNGPGAGVDAIFADTIEIDGTIISARSDQEFLAELAVLNANGTVPVVGLPDRFLVNSATNNVQLILPVSGTGPFTVRATHGNLYTPPLPTFAQPVEYSKNDPRTNRLLFSKIQQPEAVPLSNYLFVGEGTILKLWATDASLFVFCSDGIFRIDGDGDDWAVSPVNPDTILLAPDAVDSIDNTIYALTTAGLVTLNDANGVDKISSPLIGDSIRALWKQFQPDMPYTFAVQLACDKYRNEVWLNFNGTDDDTFDFAATYIWNSETSTFTTQSAEEPIAIAYVPFLQSIVLGDATLQLLQYSEGDYMPAEIEFNPVFGEDVGYLKQWIDVTLLFEEMSEDTSITPSFEGVSYSVSHTITAGNNIEEVAPVLQDYAYNKHCRFGVAIDGGDAHWALLGATYRYRIASETLRD